MSKKIIWGKQVAIKGTKEEERARFLGKKPIKRVFVRKHLYQVSSGGYGEASTRQELVISEDCDEANLIGSLTEDGFHAPVLDIDFGVDLVPSMSPGHHHLYLNKRLTWNQYKKLLEVMAEVGILEKGWVQSCITNGMTLVRKPALEVQAMFGSEAVEEE